jgi:SAM-dependent methyltransferase
VSWPDIANDPDYWCRGYFHASELDPGLYKRDFDELRRRDLALFALGDVRGKTVLDVACGSGLYLVVLAKMGAFASGQDISEESVNNARLALARHSLDASLRVGTATRLLFDDASFDGAISGDFVEHISISEKRMFFAEIYRVLKPGGIFVIKTPNLTYLKLANFLRRIEALAKGRSPLRIHIEHTRNNPDNQHHGLATFRELEGMLREQLFHSPVFIHQPLSKRPLPSSWQEKLPTLPIVWSLFNRDVIVSTRKPLGCGYFP